MVNGQKHLSACSQDLFHALALTSTVPPVDDNNGSALCCQHLIERVCWQTLSAVLPDLTWVCWLFAGNHSGLPPHIIDAKKKLWAKMFHIDIRTEDNGYVKCQSFVVIILQYHVYLLVPRLCSGEADDFSWFSLLSCFHGLLDRKEEAEVRI